MTPSMESEDIIINEDSFRELQRLYAEAVKNKADQFKFQGKDILTSYAKYLIEYLKTKIN